jgi:Cys-tRNA(Pro) deacylase
MNFPHTPATEYLQREGVVFTTHLFEYQDKGGTSVSSAALGVSEHAIVKTLIMKGEAPLIVLMHGDCKVNVKELAQQIGVKKVAPVAVPEAEALSGYLVGGTSPFGVRTAMPVYLEKTILDLPKIYINGGGRGFLVALPPKELVRVLRPILVSVAIPFKV